MDKARAREYLIKSKLYRFLALVFACAGVVVLCVVAFQQEQADGSLFALLRDPLTILLLIFPFTPAIVLSYMAQHAEKKLQEYLKDQ